jgi:hypothetical protein
MEFISRVSRTPFVVSHVTTRPNNDPTTTANLITCHHKPTHPNKLQLEALGHHVTSLFGLDLVHLSIYTS